MKFSNKLTNLIVYLFIIILSLFGCSYSGKITYETCQDVCDGLIGYYPFFGNANDVSGNKNHGKVVGAQLTSDRNENQEFSFFGSPGVIFDVPFARLTTYKLKILMKF